MNLFFMISLLDNMTKRKKVHAQRQKYFVGVDQTEKISEEDLLTNQY